MSIDISKVYSLNKQEINKILEENSKSEDGEPVPSNPQKRPIDDIKNKYEQNNKKDDTKDTNLVKMDKRIDLKECCFSETIENMIDRENL